jgi:iron complex transport system ATP-binding protein
MPMSTPEPLALAASHLAVGYRSRGAQRAVLRGINVGVRAGELVCVVGPNGIGKSTLIRTLASLQSPLSGSVSISGQDLRRLPPRDVARRLGVVLTERLVVHGLTARQIVELGRYPHTGWFGGFDTRDADAVTWALDAVGATHLAERDFQRLSDGERQRVLVARALAQDPAVLILDEPTAFLDVQARIELLGLLRALTRQRRLAVVMSTHELELALRVADSVWLILPDGRLVSGAPALVQALIPPQWRQFQFEGSEEP